MAVDFSKRILKGMDHLYYVRSSLHFVNIHLVKASDSFHEMFNWCANGNGNAHVIRV